MPKRLPAGHFAGNKLSLPRKPCVACGRAMTWRRRWARQWEVVRYCSDACRGPGRMNRASRHALFALGLAGLALLAMVPARATETLYEFDVHLDRRTIGTHRFTVQHDADTVRVQSVASFDVRLLGITAYRYRHQATEVWKGGCLATLDATTNDNGKSVRVAGQRREARFQLEQPAAAMLPDCLSAYAYWNRDLLLRQRALLNPQTGKLDPVRIESLGAQPLQLRGGRVTAEHYRLHATQYTIDLWYSPRGEWLQLESTTGSRRLVYRLRNPA